MHFGASVSFVLLTLFGSVFGKLMTVLVSTIPLGAFVVDIGELVEGISLGACVDVLTMVPGATVVT